MTSDQEEAAEFLYDIANVGRNMIVHPDISNMNLRSEHFGVILAALCELRSVIKTIKLDNNPWDKSGVGPSRDHYRKFIVARMGDGLESVDGILISEDERGQAAEWFEVTTKQFGKAAKNVTNKWGSVKEKGKTIAGEYASMRYKRYKEEEDTLHQKLPDAKKDQSSSRTCQS